MVTPVRELPAWHRLAGQCISAFINDDIDRGCQLITQIDKEHGGAGEWPMILASFIDAMLYVQGLTYREYGPGLRSGLLCQDDDGTLHLTDDHAAVRDSVEWCAALVEARQGDDRDAFYELIRQVPAGETGRYIAELCICTGLTIRVVQQQAQRHG
jgi:hypothetical protein